MAHAGRDTGGSQFFLTFQPTPHLNGKHTCFGRVIEGMDVLAKLQRSDPQAEPKPERPTRSSRPKWSASATTPITAEGGVRRQSVRTSARSTLT